MKTIKQLQAEEEARRREFDEKIKKMKAKEATRFLKIADAVKLSDHEVSDQELEAGFRHAISLCEQRHAQSAAETAEA